MLESAEVGHRVSKAVYNREEPKLREALLSAQFDMGRQNRGPVLTLVSGVEGGGRGETANKLNEWMDPRHIRTHAFGPRTPEEAARPVAWRYWRALPPRGKLGIFMNAWYRELIIAHVLERLSDESFNSALQEIRQYEQMLAAEGIVLVKFWIHLSQADQKRRLKNLESDPKTRWRVTARDRKALRLYGKYHDTWEQMLRETSIAAAPWYVIEGFDENYRVLTVGKILLSAMRAGERRRQAGRASRGGTRTLGDRQRRVDPQSGPHAENLRRILRAGTRQVAGQARATHPPPALWRARARAGVRGRRRRRQGRRHPPRLRRRSTRGST